MTSTDKILDIQNLTVSFDGFKVLDGLNFSINRGELRFLIGPNGAGKTTLLDVITGKVKSYRGKVLFHSNRASTIKGFVGLKKRLLNGHSHGWSNEQGLVQQGISRKFQTPSIFPNLTVYDNIEAAIGFNEYYVQLFANLPGAKRDKVCETLQLVGLENRWKTPAGELSHGQKQWLEIGMLLVQTPELLLLDEPVAGMSRAERDRTGELLSQIEHNCSILVIEHDMLFVRQFASMTTVLHQGRVLREGNITDIQNDPEVKEVYLGHNHNQQKKTA